MSFKMQLVRGMVAATLIGGFGVTALVQAQRPAPAVMCRTTANERAVVLPTVVIEASESEQLPRLASSGADVCTRLAAR